MNSTKILLILSFLFIISICQVETSKLNHPKIIIENDSIVISEEISQGYKIPWRSSQLFFRNRISEIPRSERNKLDWWGELLNLNPDAQLYISGFFSPSFDDITTIERGSELANKRARNVLYYLSSKFPNISDRLHLINYHVPKSLIADSILRLGGRAEVELEFSNFTETKFITGRTLGYWNMSYKDTIERVAPILRQILKRNPSSIILLKGIGFPNTYVSYRSLNFLRRKLGSKIGGDERIILFTDPNETTDKPYALLEITAVTFSPAEILWIKPFVEPTIDFKISEEFKQELHDDILYCISSSKGFGRFIGKLHPSETKFNLLGVPILNTDYEIYFFFSELGVIDSNTLRVIITKPNFLTFEIDIWNLEEIESNDNSEVNLWFAAKTVANLPELSSSAKVTIIVPENADSIGEQCWNTFANILSIYNYMDRKSLLKWIKQKGIKIEILFSGSVDFKETLSNFDEELNKGLCTFRIEIIGK